MATIFSKIVMGDIPSCKVAEDDSFYAFLDINPLAVGHTLVVPKKEIDYIFDIEDEHFEDLFLFAKRVACAIEKAVPCKRIGIAVYGLDVPHAHIHLIPLHGKGNELDFSKPKVQMSEEDFVATASKIHSAFESMSDQENCNSRNR